MQPSDNAIVESLPKVPWDSERCNGRNSDGSLCEHQPGWGTDHVGTGRCKLHGGASLKGAEHPNYKHGQRSIYAKYVNADIAQKIDTLNEGDPFDIIHELQLQRALLADFTESKTTLSPADREWAMQSLERISKTAERMTRMRNDTALTAAELKLIAARLADVVSRHITEPDAQARFLADLFASIGVQG